MQPCWNLLPGESCAVSRLITLCPAGARNAVTLDLFDDCHCSVIAQGLVIEFNRKIIFQHIQLAMFCFQPFLYYKFFYKFYTGKFSVEYISVSTLLKKDVYLWHLQKKYFLLKFSHTVLIAFMRYLNSPNIITKTVRKRRILLHRIIRHTLNASPYRLLRRDPHYCVLYSKSTMSLSSSPSDVRLCGTVGARGHLQ